jgi:hypothetical protein
MVALICFVLAMLALPFKMESVRVLISKEDKWSQFLTDKVSQKNYPVSN